MEPKSETPSKQKSTLINKLRQTPMNCDSPFRHLPSVSTPPSRFTRISNPFEQHIIERLHLPTFSPSVFAHVSTPKNAKFKWTIDDISSLKPADIDEATISQHVSEHDPTIESLVQEKIDKFFNEKAIVPSPFNVQLKQMPLIASPQSEKADSSAQTVLSLPPILPKHVEEALAPYFNFYEDQQNEANQNSSLYRKLFEFEEHHSRSQSVVSSPAPSTGLSPIQFSPEFKPKDGLERSSSLELPELRDCTLSPIGRSPQQKSVCRLNFSSYMSVDASMVVPDVNKSLDCTKSEVNASFKPLDELPMDSINWDMEYKHVSILSKSPDNQEFLNNSDSNTPHSKIFTSQRKRLSDSFKDDEFCKDVEMDDEIVPKRLKNRLNDVTDAGYDTGGATMSESSLHMFASTPTKKFV